MLFSRVTSGKPDLSVIILTYNTRDFTLACVRAVLTEVTASPYTIEVIVVDNASTDDTVARLREQYPAVRLVVNEANLGFALGNNVGLAMAQGRYLLLLNSDTETQANALTSLVAFMEAHPDAGACGPQLLNSDGSLQPSGRDLPSVWGMFAGMTKLYRLGKRDFYLQPGRDYCQVARVGEVSGAALLVRREVYEKVGGLDPNIFAYYEDIDWCKRIGEAGYAVYYVPSARVMHHWKSTARTVSHLAYRASQDSQRYYFAKHHRRLANWFLRGLLVAKELALILFYFVLWDHAARRFHQHMLFNAFAPLRKA